MQTNLSKNKKINHTSKKNETKIFIIANTMGLNEYMVLIINFLNMLLAMVAHT